MFYHPTPSQRRLQYTLIIAGLASSVAGVITFFLLAMVLVMAGLQYSHLLAIYMNQLPILHFMMPQGTLEGAAWLLLVIAYVSLGVSTPALFILYLGGADAN